MQSETPKLDMWALVELMGHNRIVGRVTEETIAGTSMLRVDVPKADGSINFTRFYGGASIYAISPIEKETAIALAQKCDSAPVRAYELPQPKQTEYCSICHFDRHSCTCEDDSERGDENAN